MDATTRLDLHHKLLDVNIDADAVARAGGGIWCFGSRASGCASEFSDWDVLIVGSGPTEIMRRRLRNPNLDLVHVALADIDAWATTELAAHVAAYGVRIDDGRFIKMCSRPLAAAPRKLAVVTSRATHLDRLLHALEPSQQLHALVRLRRDLHRAWLLSRGMPIPPTPVLDAEWDASSRATRAAILRLGNFSPRVSSAASAFGA